MKKYLKFIALAMAAGALVTACNRADKPKDAEETAEEAADPDDTDEADDDVDDEDDADDKDDSDDEDDDKDEDGDDDKDDDPDDPDDIIEDEEKAAPEDITNGIEDGVYSLNDCSAFTVTDDGIKATGSLSIWGTKEYSLKNDEIGFGDNVKIAAYDDPEDEDAKPSKMEMSEFKKYASDFAKYDMLNLKIKKGKIVRIEIMS